MVFSRVTVILACGFVTFIFIPAHYKYGTPVWMLGAVWLGSLVPILALNWATRSMATEIWLKLPPSARQSAQAAMTYAKNLPRDATLEIRFMRWTSHVANLIVKLVDTAPTKDKWFRPLSFKCTGPNVDHGTFFRPNPSEFFVMPRSAKGRAERNTIPGLWAPVYQRLAGKDPASASKWGV